MSHPGNGELTPSELLTEQKNTSSSEFGTILASEKWLLTNGLISETSADTLLGYAYMLPGVDKADISINLDYEHGGENPSVSYKLNLSKQVKKKYLAFTKAIKSNSLFSKLKVLYYFWKKIPAPGFYENQLTLLAKRYLPDNYQVNINVE